MKMPIISHNSSTEAFAVCFQLFQASDRCKGKYLPSIAIDWKTKMNFLSDYQCPFPGLEFKPATWVCIRFSL